MTEDHRPVVVKSEEFVFPSDPSAHPSESYPLGPLDTLVPAFIPVSVVFVYAPSAAVPFPLNLKRLKSALTALLDRYPVLAGRLTIASDGSRSVDRLSSGAQLYSAECSACLSAFAPDQNGTVRLQDFPGEGNALLPPFEGTTESAQLDPVFAIQHTRFEDGAAALGVTILHTLTDAEGFFQVVNDLIAIYRQLEAGESATLNLEPVEIRSYYSDLVFADDERAKALAYRPEKYHTVSQSVPPVSEESASLVVGDPTQTEDAQPDKVVGRLLRFSKERLASLKAEASIQPATTPVAANDSISSTPSHPHISTFSALSAYIYRCVTLARQQLHANGASGPLSPPDFLAPINVRRHLAVSSRYFPNALFTTYTTVDPTVFAQPNALPFLASVIHAATHLPSLTTPLPIDETLWWMAAQADKNTGAIQQGFRGGNGSLMISQWSRIALYEPFDRDGEIPVLVAPPFTRISLIDGLGYVLPARDDGGLDVYLALSERVWGVLDRHTW